jgi:predicted aspartyl protease
MIEGEVTADNEMTLPILIYASDGRLAEFRAVIDTGFSDYLTLLPVDIARLGLIFQGRDTYLLGDGNVVEFDSYRATVVWDGQNREVLVLASESGSLLGMRLLKGSVFFSDVRDGGRVLVRAF